MKRHLLCGLLVFCSVQFVAAQGESNSLKGTPIKERIVTGGGFGLGFSGQRDFFSVSPMLGYQLTTRLMAGTGVTYRYTSYKVYTPSIKLNDYGLNPFARFTVYKNIFLQAEYEYLDYEFPVTLQETTRQQFSSFLAGGGFVQPMGDKIALYVMALYNFSYKTPAYGDYSPYRSPFVLRAGFNVGNLSF
jgi:hypothetical protein